jgi:hypothetical protein
MKSNLKDQQTTHPADEKIVARSRKTAYSSPVLQVYGAVGKLTQSVSPAGPGDGVGMRTPSDRHTKENIVEIGTHPLGIGLYLFGYKSGFRQQWGCGRQFGVMADEVETVMPEAVSVHPDGYKTVNYGMLGVYRSIQ